MKTKHLDSKINELKTLRSRGELTSIGDEMLIEFNEIKQAINYTQCCTELICNFDDIDDGSLTKGKTYKKIHEHNGMIVVINDFDEVMSYNKAAFFKAN